jgi:hypothetical protein
MSPRNDRICHLEIYVPRPEGTVYGVVQTKREKEPRPTVGSRSKKNETIRRV